MTRRLVSLLAIAPCVLALAACGSSSHSSGSSGNSLVVSAAASLKAAFTHYGATFEQEGHGRVHFSFAGSDALAAQIEQGARPDVFASANLTLPNGLYAKGLVGRPVAFAANRLVLAVPENSPKIASFSDAGKPGVTLAVGSKTVPIGAYTRLVLAKLSPAERQAIEANIHDEEPDVSGIIGKLLAGAVDAGFLYVTDVRAADGKLKDITLPETLEPTVAYGVAITHDSPSKSEADAFIKGLLHGAGQQDLQQAGFLSPPRERPSATRPRT